jgi:hypothetical protein
MFRVGKKKEKDDPTRFFCPKMKQMCPGRSCIEAHIHTATPGFRAEFNVDYWYTCSLMPKIGRFDGNGGRYDI